MTKLTKICLGLAFSSFVTFPSYSQAVQSASHVFSIDASKPVLPPETGYLQLGSEAAGKSPEGRTISVNSRYLVLDSKPWLPAMGEFHYTRYPKKYWEEEILKMKAGGIQIVATYVFWIHHEEIEGQFDWSGDRDLRTFIQLCGKHGLYAYPRIGPWDHGEVRNGGFPDWLLKKKVATRVIDSTFFIYVRRLYGEIGKQLQGLLWKDGGPIIGIQIENEYANRGPNGGSDYLLQLKKMAVEVGLDVPLYTLTGWDYAVIPPHAFIPVYGGYPDEPWAGSQEMLKPDPEGVFQFQVQKPVGLAGVLQGKVAVAEQEAFPHYPRFTAELGGGLEDSYHRRAVVAPDDIAAMAISSLGSGVNLVGYYMYHGGTNPDGKLTTLQESQATDYPNDMPVKGYDYQAPLGEFGQMQGAFRELKVLHRFMEDFGADVAPMAGVLPDVVPNGPRDTTTMRVAARTQGDRGFIFVNNYLRNYPLPEQRGVQISLKLPSETLSVPSAPIDVPSQTWFFWPVNQDLNGALLKYATAQPLARMSDMTGAYFFYAPSPGQKAEFVFNASTVASLNALRGKVARKGGRITVSGVAPSTAGAIEIKTKDGNKVHILVLSRTDSRNLWKFRLAGHDYIMLSPADVFVDRDTIHLRSRHPQKLQLSIYPKLEGRIAGNVPLKAKGSNGIFARYVASVKAEKVSVEVKQIRDAGIAPPVRMGKFYDWRNCSVALAPDDSTIDKTAALWDLALPDRKPEGLSDVFLRIEYAGDIARLSDGNKLLTDVFYNGTPWEIGLKRYGPEKWGRQLQLSIMPLRKDAPIYIQRRASIPFKGASQIVELKSVTVMPEYELTVSVARE